MPFARPTPAELRSRIAAEIEAALPGADARRRRSLEEILARMLAVAAHELHGHLAWVARQILPDTAEAAELERHAAVWGVARTPAAAAFGTVSLAGTPGAVAPAGTELRRADDTRYRLRADVPIGGSGSGAGLADAALAGAAGNAAEGTVLTLLAPVAGVQPSAVVAAGGLAGGADAETDAGLRARLLARIQAPPAGGAAHDYAAWARAVAGVGRVWVLPLWLGPGTVGVTFLDAAGGVPDTPLVEAVQAALEAARPVTAQVTVFAPATRAIDVALALAPDTVAVREAVAAALAAFFLADAEPGGVLRRSRLSAAVSAAAGESWHELIAPAADVSLDPGEIAVPGTVSFA
jgi:uncharacterized phage protein gp47/JayE